MGTYKVGKKGKYRQYILEVLRVMYAAGITHFTLKEIAEWAGLGTTITLRHVLDAYALEGVINVDYHNPVDGHSPRSYNLQTVAFFGTIVLD